MAKKEFKYSSEFAINMYLNRYQFLQQTELEEYAKVQKTFNEYNPCNIYFILRRSRVALDPNHLVITPNFVELKFYIINRDEKIKRKFRLENHYKESDIVLVTEYPYNFFSLKSKSGLNWNLKLAVIVDEFHSLSINEEPLLDHEVLYIGQAYGEDGKRTAMERLSSHSTLQKIYSEASQRNPDSEIWIMLASFTQKNISTMNGRISIPIDNEEEDFQRFLNFTNPDMKFTEKQRINYTEAALIKTFLPKYNKEYKETFPNPAHSSYRECYDLDINAIVVETDTSEARRWLYSEHKERKSDIQYWQHGTHYFVNSEDRYKIFNYDYL